MKAVGQLPDLFEDNLSSAVDPVANFPPLPATVETVRRLIPKPPRSQRAKTQCEINLHLQRASDFLARAREGMRLHIIVNHRAAKCLFVALYISGSSIHSVHAGTSLDEIEAKLSKASTELDRVDQLLADPDRNRRSAAMQILMSSDNPAYVRRSKEIGLYSSDTELQEVALKAIFDAGGPFRIILDLSQGEEEQTRAKSWSTSYGNLSSDGTTGAYPFRTDPFDAKQKCWLFQSDRRCALFLTGTTVTLDWPSGSGSLTLGTDGVLAGSFYVRNADLAVPARIPLMD